MKCANLLCKNESLYFRSGSLHAVDEVLEEAADKLVLRQKVIWLCGACSALFTIENWRPPGEQLRALSNPRQQLLRRAGGTARTAA